MENVAPAVVNGKYKNTMICKIVFLTVFLSSFVGGFSTMIALSLLVTSRSHIFTSFFKIFLLICLFGLFHGLVMLPVLLCLFGPVDISDEQQEADKEAQPDKIFSLKFIRTLLSEKYFQTKVSSDDAREMETIRHNGEITEGLLEIKKDEENLKEATS